MITDRIGLQEILLPINHNHFTTIKFRKLIFLDEPHLRSNSSRFSCFTRFTRTSLWRKESSNGYQFKGKQNSKWNWAFSYILSLPTNALKTRKGKDYWDNTATQLGRSDGRPFFQRVALFQKHLVQCNQNKQKEDKTSNKILTVEPRSPDFPGEPAAPTSPCKKKKTKKKLTRMNSKRMVFFFSWSYHST